MTARLVQVASSGSTAPTALRATIAVGPHALVADEPQTEGTVLTLKMYAARKQWPLTALSVDVTQEKVGEAFVLYRRIALEGPLDPEQRQRLLDIANKCPVHRTLTGKLEIQTSLI